MCMYDRNNNKAEFTVFSAGGRGFNSEAQDSGHSSPIILRFGDFSINYNMNPTPYTISRYASGTGSH